MADFADPRSFFVAPTALQLELGQRAAGLVDDYMRRVDAFLRQEAAVRGVSPLQLAARYSLATETVFYPPGVLTTRWWLEPIPDPPDPPA